MERQLLDATKQNGQLKDEFAEQVIFKLAETCCEMCPFELNIAYSETLYRWRSFAHRLMR